MQAATSPRSERPRGAMRALHLPLYALKFGCAAAWEQFTDQRESAHQRKEAGDNGRSYIAAPRHRRYRTGSAAAAVTGLSSNGRRGNPDKPCGSVDTRPPVLEPSPPATGQVAISPPRGKPDVVRRGRQQRTDDAYQLHRLHLALARLCLQPDRPFDERFPRSRSMRVTPPDSLPACQGCPIKGAPGFYCSHLRAALDWALSLGGDGSIGVALTTAAVPLWMRPSLLQERGGPAKQALGGLETEGTRVRK
jgi:hypothetical protein